MTITQRSILYHGTMWLIIVGILVGPYLNYQEPVRFYESSKVYYICPSDDYRYYEIVRSSEGRITAIYDRENKTILTGREYVVKTANCAMAKIEAVTLEKVDQDFFELITFRSDNEELY